MGNPLCGFVALFSTEERPMLERPSLQKSERHELLHSLMDHFSVFVSTAEASTVSACGALQEPRLHTIENSNSQWTSCFVPNPCSIASDEGKNRIFPWVFPLSLISCTRHSSAPQLSSNQQVPGLQAERPPSPLLVQLHAVPPRRADEFYHNAPPPVELGLGLEAAQLHASTDGDRW